MIGLVLTGHGSFSSGVYDSIRLIAGDIENIRMVPFEEDEVKLEQDLETAIAEVNMGKGVVCFTDLAGGTPFNVSSKIASALEDVKVIGGTNSPMLLSAIFQRDSDLESFVSSALKEGQDNIKEFKVIQKSQTEFSEGI
ncbi:PTS sugar transporter subunit IIA [Amphibacillus sp. Q70]|uniref:PTS sugar transporter subunit IIA n=1 Tax=Amphibacillus sp. Q70 TaxID=3453416 RepID=UPI003F857C00